MASATTRTISTRLPHDLIDRITEAAKRDGITRAEWLERAALAALAGDRPLPAVRPSQRPQERSGAAAGGKGSPRPAGRTGDRSAPQCPTCRARLTILPRWPRRWWCERCSRLQGWTG